MRSKVAIGLCVVWLVPALAVAQPARSAKPTKQTAAEAAAQKKADEHYERGSSFLESGGIDWAIEEFTDGFELTGEPRFLFRLGRCYEDKGEKREAVAYFQRYLAADPEGPSSDEAGTRIAKLSGEIEYEEQAERERKQSEEAEAKKRERQRAASERRRALFEKALDQKRRQMLRESERREAEAARAAARRACRNRRLRQAGLITMGAGALALVVGVKYGLDAKSANDALSDHTTGAWTDELLARQQEGDRAERRMAYLTGIGAGALLTGGILYVLGRRESDRERPARLGLRSSFGASHAAIALVGRF